MTDASQLATDHWHYIEETLRIHGEAEDTIRLIGYHYRSAMIHGIKHGLEMCGKENSNEE